VDFPFAVHPASPKLMAPLAYPGVPYGALLLIDVVVNAVDRVPPT